MDSQIKIINRYITEFYPHINEVTSLDGVNVWLYNGRFFFSYGKQAIIAIKKRAGDYYDIKGIIGFSLCVQGLLSLNSSEFKPVILKWICYKHPEITDYDTLYNFCKLNHKQFEDKKTV